MLMLFMLYSLNCVSDSRWQPSMGGYVAGFAELYPKM
jgi:hypothetical protein